MSIRLGHSIRLRFFIGFLSLIVVFVLMIPFIYKTITTLQHDSAVIISQGIQQRRVVEMAFFLNQYAITGGQEFLKNLDASIKEFNDTLLSLGGASEETNKLWESYRYTLTSAQDKLIAVREGKDIPLSEIARLRERTTEIIPQLVLSINKIVTNLERVSSERIKSTVTIMIGLLIAAIVLALLFTYAGIKMIIQPIVHISEDLAAVSRGDLRVAVDAKSTILGFTFRDEITLMVEAINKIIKNLRASIEGIYLTSQEVSKVSSGISRFSQNIQQSAQAQFQAAEESSSSVEEMDASIKSIATDAEELLKATEGASASSLEMSSAVSEVAESTEKLAYSVEAAGASINEIAASLNEVTSHINTLLAQTEEVVSASTEINSTIKEVGSHSREQAVLAEKVRENASVLGMEAVNRIKDGMSKIKEEVSTTAAVIDRLGEKSKEIGKVTGVIKDVTETTHLLALNASILAAKAGEHGKGFAVVAEEVKELAEKTTLSTKEIGNLIGLVQEEVKAAVNSMSNSLSRVGDGVDLAKNSGDILAKIVDSAEVSFDMAVKIEKASEEQTKGIGQVTQAIHQINRMVAEIKKAMDEQKKALDGMVYSTEAMRDITTKVKQSIKEQSQEGKHISDVITDVAQKMEIIAKATLEQKKASGMILKAVEVVERKTEENIALGEELDKMVGSLNKEEASLKEKVGGFKI